MNLSTAISMAFCEESEMELSTGEGVHEAYAGQLSDYEQELLAECQAEEDRKQDKLDRIQQAVSKICFDQFPWLRCEAVKFCKQQRRDELVLIITLDNKSHLPKPHTAEALTLVVLKSDVCPWKFLVEYQPDV